MQKMLSNLLEATETSIIAAIAFVVMILFIMVIIVLLFDIAYTNAPVITLLVVFIAATYRVVVAMLTGK